MHFLRVKDVEYRLDRAADIQVSILVEEEANPVIWPD